MGIRSRRSGTGAGDGGWDTEGLEARHFDCFGRISPGGASAPETPKPLKQGQGAVQIHLFRAVEWGDL